MNINNYKENRENFRKIANASPEGREKVKKIRELKHNVDEMLDNIIIEQVAIAILLTESYLFLQSDGPKKYIAPIIFAALTGYAIKDIRKIRSQRQKEIESANSLISEVLEENNIYGNTL